MKASSAISRVFLAAQTAATLSHVFSHHLAQGFQACVQVVHDRYHVEQVRAHTVVTPPRPGAFQNREGGDWDGAPMPD